MMSLFASFLPLRQHQHDLVGPDDEARHILCGKGRVLDLCQIVELLADHLGVLVFVVLHDVAALVTLLHLKGAKRTVRAADWRTERRPLFFEA